MITAQEANEITNHPFTSEDQWTLLNIQGLIISAANLGEYSTYYIANENVISHLKSLGYIVSEPNSVGAVTISWNISEHRIPIENCVTEAISMEEIECD